MKLIKLAVDQNVSVAQLKKSTINIQLAAFALNHIVVLLTHKYCIEIWFEIVKLTNKCSGMVTYDCGEIFSHIFSSSSMFNWVRERTIDNMRKMRCIKR